MSETNTEPRGHVRVKYIGPIAPHWEVTSSDWGDRRAMDQLSERVKARLLLLTPDDAQQFERNKARCIADAEREAITLEWEFD